MIFVTLMGISLNNYEYKFILLPIRNYKIKKNKLFCRNKFVNCIDIPINNNNT